MYMQLCGDFVKFDVLTKQECSRDNTKVVTFFRIPKCSLHLALSFLAGPLLKLNNFNSVQTKLHVVKCCIIMICMSNIQYIGHSCTDTCKHLIFSFLAFQDFNSHYHTQKEQEGM